MSGAARGALFGAMRATRGRWRLAALSILLSTGAVVAAGALLAVSGYLVSRAAQQPAILLLTVAIVGVRFFALLRAILRYLERLVSHDLAFRTLTDLRVRFFRRLVPLVPGGLPGGVGSADVLSRFVADADRMQDLYLRGIGPPGAALLAGAAALLTAYLILPVAAVAIAALLLLGGVVAPALTRAVARRSGRRQAGARSSLAADLTQIASGAPEIAVAGRESDWEQRAASSGESLRRSMGRDALSGGLAVGMSEAVGAGVAVLMLVLAAPAVASGELPGVLLAALVLLALASIEAVAPLGAAAASVDAVSEAALRLEQVTERVAPVAAPASARTLPREGDLVMSGVKFGFDEEPGLLRSADLRIAPGRAVALVGASGVGKSTIAELLVRFRDPAAGRIELGGTDVRGLDAEELRREVRLAPQDAYLFATTIRANLELASPGAGEPAMLRALAAVGLGPWLATLPQGLDTEVGDDGARVSGGQRQRIAAARLFLSESRFVIFDEPTTHLDPATSELVLAAIVGTAHRGGRGVLVITHERAALGDFDEVLELRDGRLARTGEASACMSSDCVPDMTFEPASSRFTP